MSNGGRKDNPKPPPPAEPGSEDGLLTSDDLFGDLVDGPIDAAAQPASAAPTRQGPIRVQVSEPGDPGKEKAPVKPAPAPAELLPEDVAALLDAFSEPGEAATRAAVQAPASPPPAPPPKSPPAAAAPTTAVGMGSDEFLANLMAPEPASSVPLAPPGGSRTGGVFDLANLGKPPASVPVPAPVAAPAPAPPAHAESDGAEMELLLGEGTPAPPWKTTAPPEPAPAAADDPGGMTVPPGMTMDSLLDIADLKSLLGQGAEPPKPASRTGTKFQAAKPKEEAPERVALDLAALAENALEAAKPAASEAPAPLPPAEQVYGPYRLVQKVAVGGMAEVFKAKRSGVEGFEKIVAVKRILAHLSDNPEFVDMFIDEAKMVAGLTHPNIVQIHDLGKIDRTYYIAMEYVHGRDLRSIMKRAKERGIRIPLDLSVLIVGKICAALEYAHRKKDERGRAMKIVHRDISPQNILISFDGDVKLTDFGIAKATTKATTTERGALRGKLLYMSPEQAWGKSMDRRSDVFSLGICFYEMVTDQKPFLASSEMSILEMVRECRIAPPTQLNPRIPERLEAVVLKALERDPDLRYQDAIEMGRDLERALADRKPPTGTELARFMEVLFEHNERGDALPDEHTSGEHRPGTGNLEVEFDTSPSGKVREARVQQQPKPPVAKDPNMSIDKLLKRFGIK